MANQKRVQSRQMVGNIASNTHRGLQNKGHVSTNTTRPGKSQNQENKTNKTVSKFKPMLETQNVSTTSSVNGSFSGQSQGQLHASTKGMIIYFDKK